MSCPTLPDGRCRKTAGGGDHVDRRCAWGAKRNRPYLPRLPALTRRALPDFAEPYLSRIRIAGNKAASSRSVIIEVHSRTNLRSAARFALVIASLLLKIEPIVKSG